MRLVQIRMLTDDGVIEIPVEHGSREAARIGSHWNAIKQFLHTGDVDLLSPFEDDSIDEYRFAVDPDWIERWAAVGELDFEDIYVSGA